MKLLVASSFWANHERTDSNIEQGHHYIHPRRPHIETPGFALFVYWLVIPSLLVANVAQFPMTFFAIINHDGVSGSGGHKLALTDYIGGGKKAKHKLA